MVKYIILIALIVLPTNAHATVYIFNGAEQGGLSEEINTSSGTVSINSTNVQSGTYSIRSNPTTTAIGYVELRTLLATGAIGSTDMGQATGTISMWIRVDTCPAAREQIMLGLSSLATQKFSVYLNSDCTLTLHDQANTALATSSAAMNNTFKFINLKVGGGTSNPYELLIDGASQFSGTGNFLATTFRYIRMGKTVDTNGSSLDMYMDTIVIDNSDYMSNTTAVGVLLPDSAGTHSAWTGGTGSAYTEVDELPQDGNTTHAASTANGDIITWNFQSAASKGISGTIHAVKAITLAAETTSVLNTAYQTQFMSGAFTATTTSRTDLVVGFNTMSGFVTTTDSNTGSAFTTSGLDGLQLGGIAVDQVSTTFKITQATIHVLYTPAAAPATSPNPTLIQSGYRQQSGYLQILGR